MRDYVRDGWALGGTAMSLVRHQPGLKRYFFGAALVLLVSHAVVAELIILLRDVDSVALTIALLILAAYETAVLTTAAAVGLAAMSDRIIAGENPTAAMGARLAVARLPQVAAWAAFVVVVGIPARLVTPWGVQQVATVVLGFSLAVIAFFAVPAIALKGDGPRDAARRSIRMVREFWAGEAAGVVYVWLRPALFVGLPGLALLAGGVALHENGFDYLGWTVGAVGVITMAIAYFLFVCARSVLSVALFRIAETGTVPETIDAERLRRLMRSPASLTRVISRMVDGERVQRFRAWVHQEETRAKR